MKNKILACLLTLATLLFVAIPSFAQDKISSLAQVSAVFQAQGDMMTLNSGTLPLRIPIGTTGQCLTVSASGIPTWTSAGSVTDLTISGNVTFTAASAKIIPGATSLLIRNNADSASNIAITDAGIITIREGLFGSVVNKSWANGLSAIPADVTTISTPQMLLFNGSSGGAGLITAQGANDANGTNNSFLKSRATDGSADTIVQSGDILSLLTFYGANGTTFDPAARIRVSVSTTPGVSADMPGKMQFQLSPDASATPADVLTLDQDKSATFTGAIKSTATNVGWQIRSGANTACNTTCTAAHGCLFGQDTGSANIAVDCANATADVCVCSF